jgi:hypothetical protein
MSETERVPVWNGQIAFIAGPYRADTPYGIRQNIHAAEEVALKYIRLGYLVHCPHMATRLFDGLLPDHFWLSYHIKWLEICNVLVAMKGWKESRGAIDEINYAIQLNKIIIWEE